MRDPGRPVVVRERWLSVVVAPGPSWWRTRSMPRLPRWPAWRDHSSWSWPLFDARRQQVDDLSDAGRTEIWAAGGGIDPAEVGLAVELRERVEECACGRAGLERCGDVVGKIAASGAFRGQLNGHVIAYRHAYAAQTVRSQGQHPSAAGRQ